MNTSLKAKNNVPYSKLWQIEDFLRKKSDMCHHWYLKAHYSKEATGKGRS